MYRVIYSAQQLQEEAQSHLPPQPLGTLTGCSIRITNQSMYGLQIKDIQGNLVDYVMPYTWQLMPIHTQQQLFLEIDPNTITSISQPYQMVSVTTMQGLHAFSTGSAWQTNNNTLTTKLKMDAGSGQLSATSSAIYVAFQNELAFIELWNLDKDGKPIYFNFNQPATGGVDDMVLLPDPNGGGQGAYYSAAADYTGVWYVGGAGQVAGWYQSP